MRLLLTSTSTVTRWANLERHLSLPRDTITVKQFAGGIVPVANHVSAFCDQVSMMTLLGSTDSQDEFIRGKVDPKVDQIVLYLEDGAPTIVKRRFIQGYPRQILFELYVMGDGESKPTETEALTRRLAEVLPNYDLW